MKLGDIFQMPNVPTTGSQNPKLNVVFGIAVILKPFLLCIATGWNSAHSHDECVIFTSVTHSISFFETAQFACSAADTLLTSQSMEWLEE